MAKKHFYEQKEFTSTYLIPYFEKYLPDFKNMRILEVGCAEAGFLDVLNDMNIDAIGIELEEQRVKIAKELNPNLEVLLGNITDEKFCDDIGQKFDLIVMRDVIEHIPDRMATFANLRKLLEEDGYLYITFPPRFSAFAGHQQNYHSILKYFPYLQLFPDVFIKILASSFKENPGVTEQVILNYKVGLSLRKFEEYYKKFNFKLVVEELFFFRPIYQIRFKVKPRKSPNIPFVKKIMAYGCECLLQKN